MSLFHWNPPVVRTRIVRDRYTLEWIVKAWTAEGRCPEADYFTDSREDAEATARAMVEPRP